MISMKWSSVMLVGCLILPMLMCHGKTLFEDLDPNDAGLIEDKRPSFYAGSRYGRSQYIEPDASAGNNFQVAPRRDYHFLRYGKRSEDFDNNRATIKCYENVRGFVLTCSFTGVQDYYRCWKGQEMKSAAVAAVAAEKFATNGDNNK